MISSSPPGIDWPVPSIEAKLTSAFSDGDNCSAMVPDMVTVPWPGGVTVMPIVPLNEVTFCALWAARRIACRADGGLAEVPPAADWEPPPGEQAASTVAAPASAARRGREPV